MAKQGLIPTEMKLKQARHTCYNTSHLCKHQRQQEEGTTLSHLGPQNHLSTTENPLDFSGREVMQRPKQWPKGMAQNKA